VALREMDCKAEHWIRLVPDRDEWRVLINKAMTFRVIRVKYAATLLIE